MGGGPNTIDARAPIARRPHFPLRPKTPLGLGILGLLCICSVFGLWYFLPAIKLRCLQLPIPMEEALSCFHVGEDACLSTGGTSLQSTSYTCSLGFGRSLWLSAEPKESSDGTVVFMVTKAEVEYWWDGQ